jgi:hypothetical protein
MKVEVAQRHIDAGLRNCGSACAVALAVKEEVDKDMTIPSGPPGYHRLERTVSVSSSVWVSTHLYFMRKGREEVHLKHEHYQFGSTIDFNIHDDGLGWMVDFDYGNTVASITIELTKLEDAG